MNRYPEQKSCFQQLERRKLYYIEALHSNYLLDDHVHIHAKFPGSNSTKPLDSDVLVLYSKGILGNTGLVAKMKPLHYMFM